MNQQKPRIEAIYPLSPMQQGMLFHTLYAPHSGVYVEQMAVAINTKLDVPAFKQAWQRVVARHAVLRTLFVWEKRKKPLQVVRKEVELPWREQDWRLNKACPDEGRNLDAYLATERELGFELNKAPLMRFALMQVADDAYYFVWTFHHLLLDGWSTPLLLQEVDRFYDAICGGNAKRTPLERPRPYKDYITWLQQQDLVQAKRYWQQALQEFTAPTPFVVDHADGGREGPYVEHHFHLSPAVTDTLSQLARQNRLTFNTLMQGAWALLLSRYSGEQDVLFGATVSGRPPELRGVETMIGLFINTLPVRVKVPAEAQLLPWLQQVQQQQLEREEYAYTPLVDIQAWSEVPAGMPLFESLLVFENYPVADQQTGGLQMTSLRSVEQTNYPLTVVAELLSEREEGAQLRVGMNYDISRFDHETICRMADHLQTLLEGIAANPEQAIAHLPLLLRRERHQLLVEWNDTTASPLELGGTEGGLCFHQLFQQQVERTPEAIAVVFENQRLTYRELNARANYLAQILLAPAGHDKRMKSLAPSPLSPSPIVGLLGERNIEFLIGMLAIFKAGGVYLPLDPFLPAQRLSYIIKQSQATLILASKQFEPLLDTLSEQLRSSSAQQACPEEQGVEVLWLDPRAKEGNREGLPLPVRGGPDSLAYVIFTSGSTGLPKGAMIEHKGMLNHLYAKCLDLDLTAADTVAQNAPQSFDISVWQFLSALLVGGRVHIFDDEVARDPEQLLAEVAANEITILEVVPSVLRVMIESNREQDLSKLRWLVPTGEALPPELCRQWFERYPHIPMINAYGPTECSDDVTHYPIYEPPAPDVVNMPIGRPLINMQMYILDQHLQPVPIGVAGELYVGGIGVGRGYLHDPERTQQAFIKTPLLRKAPLSLGRGGLGGEGKGGERKGRGSEGKGLGGEEKRLYKTGDLCRYLPDGNIEFLGRIDHQVKIRGFRIELGEIEAVLSQHPSLREVVVLAREEGSAGASPRIGRHLVKRSRGARGEGRLGKRLVAYLVSEEPVSNDELRVHLAQKLPDYMQPSAFVRLDALPLTPNGKIDRRALPAPDEIHSTREKEVVLPRTPTEESLAAIWEEVLGLEANDTLPSEQIGIHDNFFELGGHSLLATQVISRSRQLFQVELPLRTLFEEPTVARLAARLEKIIVTQTIQQSVEPEHVGAIPSGSPAREEIAI
jgi:amino acid adenylation domain-containing protein